MPNSAEAKSFLIKTFSMSEVQAQAILEMRLQRLTGLERGKIENEYRELKKKIEYFESLLSDQTKILGVYKTRIARNKRKLSR